MHSEAVPCTVNCPPPKQTSSLFFTELCHKTETLRLVIGSEVATYLDSLSHFFFPGLISARKPATIWSHPNHPDYSYSMLWIVCTMQASALSIFFKCVNYAAANSKTMDIVEVPGPVRICM